VARILPLIANVNLVRQPAKVHRKNVTDDLRKVPDIFVLLALHTVNTPPQFAAAARTPPTTIKLPNAESGRTTTLDTGSFEAPTANTTPPTVHRPKAASNRDFLFIILVCLTNYT
jgi:hypothetical protein